MATPNRQCPACNELLPHSRLALEGCWLMRAELEPFHAATINREAQRELKQFAHILAKLAAAEKARDAANLRASDATKRADWAESIIRKYAPQFCHAVGIQRPTPGSVDG